MKYCISAPTPIDPHPRIKPSERMCEADRTAAMRRLENYVGRQQLDLSAHPVDVVDRSGGAFVVTGAGKLTRRSFE